MQTGDEKRLMGTTIWRRGIWYFMRTVLIVAAVIALCYCAFVTALRMGNLYILATEGMQLRATCILEDGDREQLRQYFTDDFLASDTALGSRTYQDFTVTNMDYRVEVKGISVWPSSEYATVTVDDRMASLSGDYNGADASVSSLPAWQGARYQLGFARDGDRWRIYQIRLLQATPSGEPAHTPDPNMTPFVAPTRSPVVTPTPTPSSTLTPAPSPTPTAAPTPTPKKKAKSTPKASASPQGTTAAP